MACRRHLVHCYRCKHHGIQLEWIQLQPINCLITRSCNPTWADVINRANLGMEVMHERNAHNFPLDLASVEVAPVALTAPAING